MKILFSRWLERTVVRLYNAGLGLHFRFEFSEHVGRGEELQNLYDLQNQNLVYYQTSDAFAMPLPI